VAALVALPLVAWIVIASQLLDNATERFKLTLEHAFWVAAWVALPLAAWLVIASQLLGHEIERARATRAYRADFESKMVSDDEGGLVF
jgi:Na+-driven multidrug efflux pump